MTMLKNKKATLTSNIVQTWLVSPSQDKDGHFYSNRKLQYVIITEHVFCPKEAELTLKLLSYFNKFQIVFDSPPLHGHNHNPHTITVVHIVSIKF